MSRRRGVDVTEELYDDMPHVWHMFAGILPKADHAIASVGRWLAAVGRPPSTR